VGRRRGEEKGKMRDEKGTGAGFGGRVGRKKGGKGLSYCDERGVDVWRAVERRKDQLVLCTEARR
jgi:hypothetical protein